MLLTFCLFVAKKENNILLFDEKNEILIFVTKQHSPMWLRLSLCNTSSNFFLSESASSFLDFPLLQ